MMQFGKGIYIMNQTKIQDVIRHISKDEDYGVDMMEKLSLADAVEVMAVVLPSLKKRAKEMGNTNDLAYFGRIEEIYAKVIADKLRKEEHLWVVYSSTTSYPYMVDSDLFVLLILRILHLLRKSLSSVVTRYQLVLRIMMRLLWSYAICIVMDIRI